MTAACRCPSTHVARCFNAPEPELRRYAVTVTVEIEAADSDAATEEIRNDLNYADVTIDQVEEIG